MKTSNFLLIILSLFCINLFADATRVSINVPSEVETIQQAIEEAVDGDVIIVSPGTYYENINFLGKAIVIGSMYYTTQDTSYVSQTVIDGGQSGRVVTFDSGEDTNSVLSGFTITHGESSSGGGIYCDNNTSPTLENLKVIDNQANNGGGLYFGTNSSANLTSTLIRDNNSSNSGGGAYMYYCNLIMEDIVVESNECESDGGGISCISSDLTMENVSVINNTASEIYSNGGGISNYWESVISMDSCLIDGNYAGHGGGIHCYEMSSLNMQNTVIGNNESKTSGGGIYYSSGSELTIENSEIVNNSAGYKGGGLCLGSDNMILTNVLIAGNTAEADGGGIYLSSWSEVIFINTTIAGNAANGDGGGIFSNYGDNDTKLINSVMWNNYPQTIYLDGLSASHQCEISMAYSNIEGGYGAIEYSDIDNVIINWLEGNIDEDPGFVDENIGNYQLLSSSPCIDSGTAYFEYEGLVLIDLTADEYEGISPDMGAFEFNGLRYGDINNDYVTDSYDASLLLMYVVGIDPLEDDPIPWEYWRMERADVDLNSEIDALDAAFILQNTVGIIELPVTGGIRGSCEDITFSHDDNYIYLNSGSELISFECTISECSNLKFGAGEVTADNCLYQQNVEKMAIISAYGLTGNILQIPYTRIDGYNDSFVTFEVTCNGYHKQIRYTFNGEVPVVSKIKAVYPNPFNPETTIEYQLAHPGKTSIEVYNIRGQKMAILLNEEQKAGMHSYKWNADGQSSGVYFVRIKNGTFDDMKKVILLK
jgi:Secretion system C-terminal sorting domain